VYRGCDYAVGAIMGLLEQAAKKRFVKSLITLDGVPEGVQFTAYDFV
jgi:hypothetical protein